LFALAAPVAFSSAVEAGSLKHGNGKIDLKMGGAIVTALNYIDDGVNSHLFHTDGVTTGTRVRYIVSGQLTETIKISGLLEHDVGQSSDGGTPTFDTNGADSTANIATFGIRHHDIKFTHKSMGALSIGRGNTASNGRSEVSLGGVNGIVFAPAAIAQNVFFMNSSTNAQTTVTLGDQGSHFDGLSRADRVRYDTPSFGGIGLSASTLNADGTWDVGAGYSGSFSGVKAKLGAQYSTAGGTGGTQSWGVSGGVLHESGLNVDFGYARQILGNGTNGGGAAVVSRDPSWIKGGIGYIAKIFSLGPTHFHLEYQESQDIATAGNDLTTVTVTALQKFSSVGSEAGMVYANYSLDDTAATNYNDITAVLFQTRLNF
jgi:hypothetical protein